MDFGVFNLSGAQQFIILLMLLASELRFELTPLHCLTVEPGMGWVGMLFHRNVFHVWVASLTRL
jgi:hypothetical protein